MRDTRGGDRGGTPLYSFSISPFHQKIEAIKARIKQNGVECDFNRHDDHALKRFLRARNGDTDKAYNMLTAALVSVELG